MYCLLYILPHRIWHLNRCKGRDRRKWKSIRLRFWLHWLHKMDYFLRIVSNKCASVEFINGWEMPFGNSYHILFLYRCHHIPGECILGLGIRMAIRIRFCWFRWWRCCAYGKWFRRISCDNYPWAKARSNK